MMLQRRVKATIKRLLRPYNKRMANRADGLKHETAFWDHWMRTRGADWPDEFARRLDPMLELSPYHRTFIDTLPQHDVSLLDVGAGPLTLLGKRHPTKQLAITATDPLAPEYDILLRKYAIEPPVRTVYAEAEQLTHVYAENSFDFANAQNCLDHARDPLEAIRQMLMVVKPGCFVALNHFENEAESESYHGLHQWNFSIRDGRFMIVGKDREIDVTAALAAYGRFECQSFDRWVRVHVQKY